MPVDTRDRNEIPIHEGDRVWTWYRGGSREGIVEKIIYTEEEARQEGLRLPPKVMFAISRPPTGFGKKGV